MNKAIHLVGISGSLRKDSYNTMLLKTAGQLLPNTATIEFLSIADIPVYNGDLDIPTMAARPEAVEKFRNVLAGADGIIIVSADSTFWI